MKIVVIGAGGVGGYFGGRWAQAGLDVTLVARGSHLEAIRAEGLRITSPLGDAVVPVAATADPSRLGPVDLIVVATKVWQLPQAAALLPPLLGPETLVFGLQNGVEAADVLAGVAGASRTLAGTCRLISFLDGPGRIRHAGAEPTVLFGERPIENPDESPDEKSLRAERVREQLARGPGMSVQLSGEIETETWKKLLFFAPVSGVGSVARATIGAFRAVEATREMLVAAMEEVHRVALAHGVSLPDDSVEAALRFVDGLPEDGTSSMQRDFRDGRRTELEALSGAVVRIGARHGVPTPTHSFLYAALLPQEIEARQVSD